jgi:hypothetical protein
MTDGSSAVGYRNRRNHERWLDACVAIVAAPAGRENMLLRLLYRSGMSLCLVAGRIRLPAGPRAWAIAWILAAALCLAAEGASAQTFLYSAPLKGGAGGAVCSCTSTSGASFDVNIIVVREGGTGQGCVETLGSDGRPRSCSFATTDVVACTVRSIDGKTSTKAMRCTLTSLDAAGNPLAYVPVDAKVKR